MKGVAVLKRNDQSRACPFAGGGGCAGSNCAQYVQTGNEQGTCTLVGLALWATGSLMDEWSMSGVAGDICGLHAGNCIADRCMLWRQEKDGSGVCLFAVLGQSPVIKKLLEGYADTAAQIEEVVENEREKRRLAAKAKAEAEKQKQEAEKQEKQQAEKQAKQAAEDKKERDKIEQHRRDREMQKVEKKRAKVEWDRKKAERKAALRDRQTAKGRAAEKNKDALEAQQLGRSTLLRSQELRKDRDKRRAKLGKRS